MFDLQTIYTAEHWEVGPKHNTSFIHASKRREEDHVHPISGRSEGSLHLAKYLLRGTASGIMRGQ